ncbi:MAG: hypothetical protein QOC92_1472 [Acidimicrobiaceae bacterium]
MRRALLLLAVSMVLAFAVLPASAATRTVQIKDFSFSPSSVSIIEGDTVTWTQNGAVGHSVTADDGSFDSSPLCTPTPNDDNCLKPGDSFSQTFDTAGTFSYHCRVHASMIGTVVVGAAPTTTTTSTTSPSTTTTTTKATTTTSTTASTSSTTTTSSSTTTTTTTLFSSGSGQVGIADKGGKGGSSSALPLLLGAAVAVAGLAGLAYWLWWRSGEPYDDGPDWTQEPPPTVQGPRI